MQFEIKVLSVRQSPDAVKKNHRLLHVSAPVVKLKLSTNDLDAFLSDLLRSNLRRNF